MNARRVLGLGILAFLVIGCSSPGHACTEIGCEDGLMVSLTPNSSWPHGEYRFTLEVDDITSTCVGTLPLAGCDAAAIACEGPAIPIGGSGCALPPAEHAFAGFTLTGAPARMSIEVQLDGQTLASKSWTPTYKTVQPNGSNCEPTCRNASVELAIPFE